MRSNEDIWCKILAPATSPPAVQAGAKTKMRSFDPIHNLGHSHRHHWQNEIGIRQSEVLLAFHRSHLVISRGHVMTPTTYHPPPSPSHIPPQHHQPIKCTNTLLSHVVIICLLLIISFSGIGDRVGGTKRYSTFKNVADCEPDSDKLNPIGDRKQIRDGFEPGEKSEMVRWGQI